MILKIRKKISLLFLIILLAFVLPRAIPGSPLFISDSDTHALNSSISRDNFLSFREYCGLDKSLGEQFIIYIKNIFSLNFGYSFYFKEKVITIIRSRIAWTIFLTGLSLVISTIIAIPLALNNSINDSRMRNRVTLRLLSAIQSIPSFLMAITIQLVFSYKLGLFPSSGAYTIGRSYEGFSYILDIFKHMFLPLMALILSSIPSIYIITYNVCKKTLEEDFIKMAYLYKIPIKYIKNKYILRFSLPEIVRKLNIHFLYLISGALFVETVFSYPGMGSLIKISVLNKDYPLIQALIIFIGVYGLVVNIIFDFIIESIKPRC